VEVVKVHKWLQRILLDSKSTITLKYFTINLKLKYTIIIQWVRV
jgi:hypothetical protein